MPPSTRATCGDNGSHLVRIVIDAVYVNGSSTLTIRGKVREHEHGTLSDYDRFRGEIQEDGEYG